MNEFYVYMYRRNDTNDVFYIGKGINQRAEIISGHNDHCRKVANKHGFTIEYVQKNMSEEDAFALERALIHKYVNEYGYSIEIEGMRDRANPHHLCNHTMGGEGSAGFRWDDEHKEMFRQQTTARNAIFNPLQTRESLEKARLTRKKQAERGELYIQSEEFRKFQDERMRGEGNPAKTTEARKKLSKHASTWQCGGKNNKAIGVICIDNGMMFETQIQLAHYLDKKRTDSITKAFKESKDGVVEFVVNGEKLRFKRMPKISRKE